MKKQVGNLIKLMLMLGYLQACGDSHDGAVPNVSQRDTAIEQLESREPVKLAKPVFNIPSLVGLNIDQVRKVLGKSKDKDLEPSSLQLKNGFEEWDNSFKKKGYSMLVTFNPKTRRVVDFFIDTQDPSGATRDYGDLLVVGDVNNNDTKYSIVPVPTGLDPSKFTGIKIVSR